MFDVAERPTDWPAPVLDALVYPEETAESLAHCPPGPGPVSALSAIDPTVVSDAGRVNLLVAVERQIAWLQAVQQRTLAAMANEPPRARDMFDPTGQGWVREDVACALRLSSDTSQGRLCVAAELTTRLTPTLAMLEAGEISYWHASSLANSVATLDDQAASAVQDRVLTRAARQTLSEFRRSVKRAVARVDTRTSEAKHQASVADRGVWVTPQENGMAELSAWLTADGAAAIMSAVNAIASATDSPREDHSTADQLRADALVGMAIAAQNDDLPTAHGMRPAVQVTVALSTLLGDDDQPGELAGHGPIPASMARRIAADPTGTWRRLVVDPLGRLVDCGRRTYRPPADLARHVIARDQHCVFPGCARAARRCDLDHRVRYPDGPTSAENLQPLCRRHHTLKHMTQWQVDRDPSGTYRWRSPTGHRYYYRPPEYPVPRDSPSQTTDWDSSPPF